MAERSKPNELHLTRVYDAPVAAVWDAWTDDKQVSQWWGPRGFTTTTHSIDVRPGGQWLFTMRGPDGTEWPTKTVYLEVEKHRKLVYDHGVSDDRPPVFRVTVLFSESDGKTTMDFTMALPTPEAAAETRKVVRKYGGDSTWDRLAEYLGERDGGKATFVINRSFDVPREKMFDAWTKPDQIARWLPPAGFEMQFLRVDVREGGSGFYVMTGPGGMKMHGRAVYQKLQRPELFAYTQQFVDENENPSRHPMMPTFPATMLTTVRFTEEGPDRTRVTVTWEPASDATPEEIATFAKARPGMTQGWTGSFDKLEEYASKASD